MAIALVQANAGKTANGTNPTSITPAFTAASVSGNLVVLIVGSDNTVATPSGWTLDKSQVNWSGVYAFKRTSTGETSFTVATTAGGTAWFMLEISGQAATPLDGSAVFTANAQSSGSTQTTGTTGALAQTAEIAVGVWCSSSVSVTPTSWTAETNGYTEVAVDQITSPLSGGKNMLAVATKITVGATESSTATFTSAAGTSGIDNLIVTYKAASTAAGPTPKIRQAGLRTNHGKHQRQFYNSTAR